MADKMRRHSRRAKHLIRTIGRSRHASTQDMAAHELIREIDRRHGFLRLGRRRPAAMPRPGAPGHWRPLTHRAKRILSQLRKTKVWRLQKQFVRELQKELEHGRRVIDKARERARKLREQARRAGRAAGRAGRAAGQAAGRGWQQARPRIASAGRRARDASRRRQEPMIRRPGRPSSPRSLRQAIGRAQQPGNRGVRQGHTLADSLPVREPDPIPHYRRPARIPRPRRVPRPARTR